MYAEKTRSQCSLSLSPWAMAVVQSALHHARPFAALLRKQTKQTRERERNSLKCEGLHTYTYYPAYTVLCSHTHPWALIANAVIIDIKLWETLTKPICL